MDTSLAASFTHLLHCMIRSILPWRDTIPRICDQTNNVIFDQSAFQMAGIGGNGGSGNAATGGSVYGPATTGLTPI
jgi:hypothetical protein